MHVVAVQLDIAWEDKARNRRRAAELLAESDVPADSLIVLPEMFESGFSMNVKKTVQSEQREGERFLQQLATEYRSAVMGGVISPVEGEPAASGGPSAANEAVVFGPDGSQLARYRKQRPFSGAGEDRFYAAGDQSVAFLWQGVRIAPLICYDLRFPELFRAAVRRGAEMFVVIACWPAARSEHWVRLLQARAIENLALIIGVNRCGLEPSLEYEGRSSAFDHQGRPLFEALGREQVVHCDFDPAGMRVWRDEFPALRDSGMLN